MVAAIIGGTGIHNLENVNLVKETVNTPYGEVTVDRNEDLIFLNRHAPDYSIPPHKINYRANIKALQTLGVKRVCITYATGSLNPDFKLGVPVILNDFIDFTSGREHTFIDSLAGDGGFIEMSQPFCPVMSQALADAAKELALEVRRGGVYGAVNGPRFETPAEIRAYRLHGVDVTGMTLVPEIPLALEAGMSCGAFAFSINWAAGMSTNIEFVKDAVEETKQEMLKAMIAALGNTKDEQCTPAIIL